MHLLKKARKEAQKNGVKVSPEVAEGLKRIQSMHDLVKKKNGSPSKSYASLEKKK